MTDSIQLNVEGTGPDVRTVKQTETTAPTSAGASQADTVVHQQVVTLADSRGDLTTQADILGALEAINETLLLILEQLA